MGRKKKHEEHENHERWLVSYADFITLLFAFFVSMYAISSVNEGKFRILSEALAIAFNPTIYTSTRMMEGPRFVREQRAHMNEEFKEADMQTYQKLVTALKDLESDRKLTLIKDEHRITIRITEGVLFAPGAAVLSDEGKGVVAEVAAALKELPNNLRVEGHTDNIPVNAELFETNWDLSSARALAILKFLVSENDFAPKRLAAIGYGEHRPIDTNDTPSGRARNRRVDVLIIKGDLIHYE